MFLARHPFPHPHPQVSQPRFANPGTPHPQSSVLRDQGGWPALYGSPGGSSACVASDSLASPEIITLKSQQEVFPAWWPPPVPSPARQYCDRRQGDPHLSLPPACFLHPVPASPASRPHETKPACVSAGQSTELGVWRPRLDSLGDLGRSSSPF